jgi:hypothetical protein
MIIYPWRAPVRRSSGVIGPNIRVHLMNWITFLRSNPGLEPALNGALHGWAIGFDLSLHGVARGGLAAAVFEATTLCKMSKLAPRVGMACGTQM